MSPIIITILPLLVLIIIGYCAGRYYKLLTSQFGIMVAFVLAPIVSFGAVLKLDFQVEYLFLPLFVAIICAITTTLGFRLGKIYLSGSIPNLAGMASASGNTGFFGLPIFLLYEPVSMVGIYILASVGMQIIELTYGYYIAARGNFSVKDSLMRLCTMPPLWAVIIGIILNVLGITMPAVFFDYWQKILNSWMILGMIMIGIALASCATLKPDIRFCTHMMLMRFVIWPLVSLFIVAVDYYFLGLFSTKLYFIFAVFAFIPLPGSSVAFSSTLGLHPDKMAFAVVLSTILASLLLPLFFDDLYLFIETL